MQLEPKKKSTKFAQTAQVLKYWGAKSINNFKEMQWLLPAGMSTKKNKLMFICLYNKNSNNTIHKITMKIKYLTSNVMVYYLRPKPKRADISSGVKSINNDY